MEGGEEEGASCMPSGLWLSFCKSHDGGSRSFGPNHMVPEGPAASALLPPRSA